MATSRKPGDFILEPAVFSVSETEKVDYELGTLFVPENRNDPGSRTIGVGFARFKAFSPSNALPIIYIPGGPGTSLIASLKEYFTHVNRYRAISDIILLDQRGFSHRGEMLLFHHPLLQQPLDQPDSLDRRTTTFIQVAKDAVGQYAQKGVDLRGYCVHECAADINDLRKALGYDQIVLTGNSFGSQWSFATMKLFPQIIARAFLTGVEPLDLSYDMPSLVVQAMQRSWKAAEQSKELQPYIPSGGIDAAVREVLARLKKSPVQVAAKNPKLGDTVTITLGHEDFQRDMLKKAPESPAWMLAAYHKHYETWAASVLERRRRPDPVRLIGPLIDTALGCTAARLEKLNSDPAAAYVGRWNWQTYVATAGIWPTADVGDDFRKPAPCSIPVIFEQGDWDLQTPFENAVEIVKYFPNSRLLLSDHGEHRSREPLAQHCPEAWKKILEFLRTGALPDLPDRVSLPIPQWVIPPFAPPGAR